ncbi:hypothetical protein MRX96_029450 [Rhipicephalus microplus]
MVGTGWWATAVTCVAVLVAVVSVGIDTHHAAQQLRNESFIAFSPPPPLSLIFADVTPGTENTGETADERAVWDANQQPPTSDQPSRFTITRWLRRASDRSKRLPDGNAVRVTEHLPRQRHFGTRKFFSVPWRGIAGLHFYVCARQGLEGERFPRELQLVHAERRCRSNNSSSIGVLEVNHLLSPYFFSYFGLAFSTHIPHRLCNSGRLSCKVPF